MTISKPVAVALSALVAIVGASAPESPHVAAAELEAKKLGVTIVWVDGDEACPGVESLGCYFPGQGAQITLSTDFLGESDRRGVLDVVRHEAAHYWIEATCGTSAPPILMTESGDRSENVADAYATKYFGRSPGGYYGYTDEDTAIATAIREEHRCEAVPDEPQSPTPVSVHRFWSPAFDNAHFFTTDPDEAARLRTSDPNWVAEGQPFWAFAPDGVTCTAGTTEVHRFYSMRFRSHFFTASGAEKNAIVVGDENWTYEGVAYCATTTAQPGTTPLYRFWSPKFGKHHFTTDAAEARRLDVTDPSWDAEGIAYYVAP
jgi:hypothetical protein